MFGRKTGFLDSGFELEKGGMQGNEREKLSFWALGLS